MAINFPASPSGGDRFVTSGTTYMYDGEKWTGITEVDAPGISPENLSVTNTPTSGQVPSYVNGTNFEWASLPSGTAPSNWNTLATTSQIPTSGTVPSSWDSVGGGGLSFGPGGVGNGQQVTLPGNSMTIFTSTSANFTIEGVTNTNVYVYTGRGTSGQFFGSVQIGNQGWVMNTGSAGLTIRARQSGASFMTIQVS